MPSGNATERTPLLSRSSVDNTQYAIDYSQEPITHVIPSQSGSPTYISTQTSKQCCSGLDNCSLACQSGSTYSKGCCRSAENSTCAVTLSNDQDDECCGLGLACSIKGERSACCRSTSQKVEIEINECCNNLANQPWQYKAVALLCALFLAGKFLPSSLTLYISYNSRNTHHISVGSHFAAHTLGAMKNIIKEVTSLYTLVIDHILCADLLSANRNLVSPIRNTV